MFEGSPAQQLILFQQLVDYLDTCYQDSTVQVKLLGMLNQHQLQCKDQNCPCWKSQFLEQQRDYNKLELLMNIDKQDLINETYTKRVYFFNMFKDQEAFISWSLDFIEYYFMLLLTDIFNQNTSYVEIQNMMIRFWFFELEKKWNFIKPFYISKIWKFENQNKSIFYSLVEKCLVKYIDNFIKNQDKSLKYSFRKRDTQTAIQFEKFENFVICEQTKRAIKKQFIELINLKINYLRSLINGYDSMLEVQQTIIKIMLMSEKLENEFQKNLKINPDSMQLLKIYTQFRLKILNDIVNVSSVEKKIADINRKDSTQDQNTVTSLSVIAGNVISIISSFGREQGKMLSCSEQSAQFFHYKQEDFQALTTIKQLMPKIIADYHDNFIKRLINEGTNRTIRQYRGTLGIDKDSYLLPLNLYVNYFFHNSSDFNFSGLLIKKQTQSLFLLLNEQGQIENCSYEFMELMKVICDKIQQDTVYGSYIYLFIYEMIDIIKNLDQTDSHELLNLQMWVPENLELYLKKYRIKFKEWEQKRKREQAILNGETIAEDENKKSKYTNTLGGKNFSQYTLTQTQHASDFSELRSVLNKSTNRFNFDSQKEIEQLIPNPKQNPGYFNIGFNCTCNITKEHFDSGKEEMKMYQIEFLHFDPILEQETLGQTTLYSNTQSMGIQEQMLQSDFNDQDDENQKNNQGLPCLEEKHESEEKESEQQKQKSRESFIQKVEHMDNDVSYFLDQQPFQRDVSGILENENDQQNYPNINQNQLIQNYQNESQPTEIGNNIEDSKNFNLQGESDQTAPTQNNDNKNQDVSEKNNFQINTKIKQNDQSPQSSHMSKISAQKKAKYADISDQLVGNSSLYRSQKSKKLRADQRGSSSESSEMAVYKNHSSSIVSKMTKLGGNVFSEKTNKTRQKTQFAEQNSSSSSEDGNYNNKNPSKIKQMTYRHGDHEQLSVSHLSASADKNASDIIKGRGQEQQPLQQNILTAKKQEHINGQQSSVGSTSNTINNSIRRIFQVVDSVQIPQFMKVMFSAFMFIFLVFVLLLIISLFFISEKYEEFVHVLDQISLNSKLWLPISQTILATNMFAMRNNNDLTNYSEYNDEFYDDIIQIGYENLDVSIDDLLIMELDSQYQKYLYEKIIDVKMIGNNLEQIENMTVIQYLLKLRANIYIIGLKERQMIQDYLTEGIYMATHNFKNLCEEIDKISQLFQDEIDDSKKNMSILNIIFYTIQILLLILCFSLFYFPFQKYIINVKKLLNLITRITVQEGKDQISYLNQSLEEIQSYEEYYLKQNFTGYNRLNANEAMLIQKRQDKSVRSLKSMKSMKSVVKSLKSIRSLKSQNDEKKKKSVKSSKKINDSSFCKLQTEPSILLIE
ncbi:PAS domain [Pseudocohnilembus persalinus]|uniref:PAS domain n=1 Tax=Pseudocohnilembus persalinus TaxID=266149 RepID=A0A0V0QDN6_PSEPJ|nr:PAS domain [Pseudocohnilembus persalinus]|eukprot:KRX00278.1 PAS domain [Pseudocohnilembus persalinus]